MNLTFTVFGLNSKMSHYLPVKRILSQNYLVQDYFVPLLFRSTSGGSTAKNLGMFLLHLVHTFLSKLRPSTRVPSNFYYSNADLFEVFDFSIHDFHWILHEMKLNIDPDLIEWNDKVLIRETLFKITHMEGIMNFIEFLR